MIVTWKGGFLCVALCVCPSHPTSGPTPWLKCVHASVHVYMSTWLQRCALPPLHSYMETWVLLYGTVYVSSHLISVPRPCLEWEHSSVHVFMSTWAPNSCAPPLYSYTEIWVPMCDTVCMFQSVYICSHTLFRMCTSINICICAHLTPLVS